VKTYPHIHKETVTTSASLVVKQNTTRKALLIFNNDDAESIEVVSDKDSAYGSGIPIPSKANYENLHYCQGNYYLICETGTVDARIEEDIEE